MALPFDNQVAALTLAAVNESSADNLYGSMPVIFHMKERGRISKDGGESVRFPVSYAKIAASGSFANYDILSTNATESEQAAKYDWKRYYANVVISRQEILRNSGESAAVRLVKSKVRNANLKMAEDIGTDMFSTNADSAKGILGLRQMVKATGAAGALDQSDMSAWLSDIDAATSALTLATMEQAKLDASVGNQEPDLIVTTKGVYKKYWDLLQANQRFGPGDVAKGGFKYLLFDGIPVFFDSLCPGSGSGTADNHMFLLNSNWLYFIVHQDDDFRARNVPEVAEQDVVITKITSTVIFATDNRRMHSAFTVLKH